MSYSCQVVFNEDSKYHAWIVLSNLNQNLSIQVLKTGFQMVLVVFRGMGRISEFEQNMRLSCGENHSITKQVAATLT